MLNKKSMIYLFIFLHLYDTHYNQLLQGGTVEYFYISEIIHHGRTGLFNRAVLNLFALAEVDDL